MSRGRPNGCLIATLIVVGILACFILGMSIYNSSQNGMIRKARQNQYVSLYFDYLEKFPQGKFAEEATESILSLSRKIDNVNQICEYAKRAEDANLSGELSQIAAHLIPDDASIYLWENLREKLPVSSQYIAQEKIDSIKDVQARIEAERARKEAEQWGTESAAWKTASTSNTIEDYQKYQKLYPKGSHYRQAERKIIDLEVARDFAAEHGSIPPMDRVGVSSGSYSKVRIKNDTDYKLTLRYSGTTSEKFTIERHASMNVTLPNGAYKISARVDAGNVSPYVGTENLNGDYEVTYYISYNGSRSYSYPYGNNNRIFH